MKQKRVAVVGIGFVGILHIEALRRLGNVDIVAICDHHDILNKSKNLFIDNLYDDYKKLIDLEKLDYIHICTPNNSHFEIAKYALNKEVNVILEKPMTYSIEEARELYYLSKEKNLICAVNFHNRLYTAPAYIKQICKQNSLGEITAITGYYIQDWMLNETDYSWRLNISESGKTRVVADIGSHWIDLVEYMTGLEVEEVFADFKTVHKTRKKAVGHTTSFSSTLASNYEDIEINTEDIASVLVRFNNKAIGNAMFSQSFAGKKNNLEVIIAGKESTATWSLTNQSDVIIGHRFKPNEVITKDSTMMKELTDTFDYPAGHIEGYADAFKQVFKQVYGTSNLNLYASFYDGLRQMIISEKIYESAMTQTWVKIGNIL